MSAQGEPKLKSRKKVRLSHVIFLLICFCTAIALAWWQWSRFQSGSGTFQNLGYALQWPVIGGFFIFAYRKYLEYENESIELENLEAQMAANQNPTAQTAPTAQDEQLDFMVSQRPSLIDNSDKVTEIDDAFLPERKTLDVDEFNRLNDPTQRRRRRG